MMMLYDDNAYKMMMLYDDNAYEMMMLYGVLGCRAGISTALVTPIVN